ncbi:MAG: C40 family peptidase [Bacteroidetes bacterium]|nr:C40 family peptidase [Bacteroidota bacterium]
MRLPIQHSILLSLLIGTALLAGCLPASRTTIRTGSAAVPNAQASLDRGRSMVATDPARRAVLDEAQRWLGTPYLFGGTTPSGVDCSGFVDNVFRVVKRSLPRTAAAIAEAGSAVSLSQALPGDLVFFNTSGSGVSHVGILVTPNSFIHASTSSGVIVSSLDETYYQTHVLFARQVLR